MYFRGGTTLLAYAHVILRSIMSCVMIIYILVVELTLARGIELREERGKVGRERERESKRPSFISMWGMGL